MKRKTKVLLSILCLVSLLSINIKSTKAETISYKKLNNIYFNLTVDGKYESNGVTMFYLDQTLAYCIEPGAAINTKTYNASTTWNVTNLTNDQKQKIEKIGYYGYEYPGHQTDKYYIAAQELMWKEIKNVDIYWTTEKNGQGSKIDVTKEKQEILNLINKHDKGPSFTNETIKGKVGETIALEDENQELNEYEVKTESKHKLQIVQNTLYITFNKEKVEPETITLTKKTYDNQTLVVYTMPGSQTLAALRLSSPKEINITLENIKEENPKETPKETPKEIVKVPSTSIDENINHYQNKTQIKYNDQRFTN